MAKIILETLINAPVEQVFTLSLSIDLHKLSMAKTNEEAIAGRTSGIIQEGENITWRAKHLGVTQKLTVKITKVEKPNYFRDEMVKGAFKSMAHEHVFEAKGNQTLMIDVFEFESPFGPIGRLFNALFLTDYMRKLLIERNEVIKRVAERKKYCVIYKTFKNEYKIFTESKTTAGYLLYVSPVYIIPTSCTDEVLLSTILTALDNSAENVRAPERDEFPQLQREMLDDLKEKSYSKLYKNSTSCHISIQDSTMKILPYKLANYGRPQSGMVGVDDDKVVIEDYESNLETVVLKIHEILNKDYYSD